MSSTAAAAQPAPRLPARSARLGPQEVASMLDTLAAADRHLADALDAIAGSRARVSRSTVTALERLLATLRPAADVRTQLLGVDRRVLASAIRLRRDRHDDQPRVADASTSTGRTADAQH